MAKRALDANPAVALVREDVMSGLREFFSAAPGFVPAGSPDDAPMTNGRQTAVAWEYHGRHNGTFQGIPATGRDVVIRGVTVVEQGGRGRVLFSRYVDWLDVMSQLGLSAIARPALEHLPGRRRGR
jgi:hypothetical protein